MSLTVGDLCWADDGADILPLVEVICVIVRDYYFGGTYDVYAIRFLENNVETITDAEHLFRVG